MTDWEIHVCQCIADIETHLGNPFYADPVVQRSLYARREQLMGWLENLETGKEMTMSAYREGFLAGRNAVDVKANPYIHGTLEYIEWNAGYYDATTGK